MQWIEEEMDHRKKKECNGNLQIWRLNSILGPSHLFGKGMTLRVKLTTLLWHMIDFSMQSSFSLQNNILIRNKKKIRALSCHPINVVLIVWVIWVVQGVLINLLKAFCCFNILIQLSIKQRTFWNFFQFYDGFQTCSSRTRICW